jgi:hypothetical protein
MIEQGPKIAARQAELSRELREAIGNFMVNFALIESHYWGQILQVLVWNMTLVDHLTELMDLEKRLKLVERLAEDRGLTGPLWTSLKASLGRTRTLMGHRNVIAHNVTTINMTGVTEATVDQMVGGVRLPKSKRKPLQPPLDTAAAVVRGRTLTLAQIEKYSAETLELQKSMVVLATALFNRLRSDGSVAGAT